MNDLAIRLSNQEPKLPGHAALFKLSQLLKQDVIFFAKCDVLELRFFLLHGLASRFVLSSLIHKLVVTRK